MTNEELLANRMVLRQLGYEEEEQNNYEERQQFGTHFSSDNHSKNVSDICHKIARAAFNSKPRRSGGTHFSKQTHDLWHNIKDFSERPGVQEVAVIGSILLLKMAMFFTYKKASETGLNIIDL